MVTFRCSRTRRCHGALDVDLGNRVKQRIQRLVRQTHGPEVLGKIGGFGGLFRARFSNMADPVLVSSVDSVGTGALIGAAFGATRAATVLAGWRVRGPGELVSLGRRIQRWEAPIRSFGLLAQAALAVIALAAATVA